MTETAVAALRRDSERVGQLTAGLTAEEWEAPSGCAGWRVQDVVCHMACVWHSLTEPSTIEPGPPDDAEASAEVPVQARRAWTPAQVMEDYAHWAPLGLAAMEAMQAAPLAETVIPLGNLGSHPMHLLANALVFDHYCHLRHDIGAAVPRAAALERDGESLVATREWMLAGLPQMCADALRPAVTAPVVLDLEGPGGGTWTVLPAGEDGLCRLEVGSADASASVTSNVHDFVAWGTKRGSWRDAGVRISGDEAVAEAFLDAVNVI
jgi:uncharacterized protein (TIGR03083 family)